jgi:FAD/FMN-containing dehydrogenase
MPEKLVSQESTLPSPEVTARVRAGIIAALGPGFAGQVTGPDHPDYDAARRVWNAMADRRPGLIVRCTSAADVVAAVNAARGSGLRPAVRGGGHNVAGLGTSDGGMVIDLSGMRGVTVREDAMLVDVAGGARLADLDAATGPLGLVVPAGVMSETGVGGLALGGGIGWLSRRFGLTCDQFESLEVVLADGSLVEASENSRPDLFWALRGGGGNFGVVTRFTFRAHRFGPLMRLGVALYEPRDARAALQAYARILPTLPNMVSWQGVLLHATGPLPFIPPELVGRPALMLAAMWLGDPDDPAGAAQVGRLLAAAGQPTASAELTLPFADAVQRLADADFAAGHRYYTKEIHLAELPGEAIDILIAFWQDMDMDGEVELFHLGGAVSDVPEDAAAFAHREHHLWLNLALRWDDPARDAGYIARARAAADQLRPWAGAGAYYNMLNIDEGGRVVEALGGEKKYARLTAIKQQYDPHGLFGRSQGIAPAGH